MVAISFGLQVTIAVRAHGDNYVHPMSGWTFNVKQPLALIDPLDRVGFAQLPTGAVRIYSANVSNPLMRIGPISLIYTLNPNPISHFLISFRLPTPIHR